MRKPGVMVSSTYFDLSQVRSDLHDFLEDRLGYRALLSEMPAFPIDSDMTAIENCRRRVDEDADILVLVVGGRYGSLDPSSKKSVTNLEYLSARAKGIPIYAFVKRELVTLLAVWRRNPTANFSDQVDNDNLFTFIESLYAADGVWVHQFDRAQDIVAILREQLAFQLAKGLDLGRRLGRQPSYVARLSGVNLRMVLEQPDGWQYLVLAGQLSEGIEQASHLRSEQRADLAIGLGEDVYQIAPWLTFRLGDLQRLISAAGQLLNKDLGLSLAVAEKSNSAEVLVSVCFSIAEVYRNALQWRKRVLTANMAPQYQPVAKELAHFANDVIEQIDSIPAVVRNSVNAALTLPEGDPGRQLTLKFTFSMPNIEAFTRELNRITKSA